MSKFRGAAAPSSALGRTANAMPVASALICFSVVVAGDVAFAFAGAAPSAASAAVAHTIIAFRHMLTAVPPQLRPRTPTAADRLVRAAPRRARGTGPRLSPGSTRGRRTQAPDPHAARR